MAIHVMLDNGKYLEAKLKGESVIPIPSGKRSHAIPNRLLPLGMPKTFEMFDYAGPQSVDANAASILKRSIGEANAFAEHNRAPYFSTVTRIEKTEVARSYDRMLTMKMTVQLYVPL